MKTKKYKKIYQLPIIERIKLDNEISLVLQSPTGPGEPGSIGHLSTDDLKTNPFKTILT